METDATRKIGFFFRPYDTADGRRGFY